LSGKLEGRMAFSISPKIRVVFYFKSPDVAFFENIGTHDEVY